MDQSEKVALEVLRWQLKGLLNPEDVLADHLRVLEGWISVRLERADVLGELPALQLSLSSLSLLLSQTFLRVELTCAREDVPSLDLAAKYICVDVSLPGLKVVFIRVFITA